MSNRKKFPFVEVTEEENTYRKELFKDVSEVLQTRLHCTICMDDVKNKSLEKGRAYLHKVFGVLTCKSCYQYYGDGYFSVDEDGSERYCRWCGQGGLLYLCSSCTLSICKKCIKRNMPRSEQRVVEKEDWKCYSCQPKPLYELRGLAWAFRTVLAKSKGKDLKEENSSTDKKLGNKEVELQKCCTILCDSIKRTQRNCRALDKKLLWVMRGVENTDIEGLKKAVEKYFNEVAKVRNEFDEFKVTFEKVWNESFSKLESVQDEELSTGENGVISDPEPLINKMTSGIENSSNEIKNKVKEDNGKEESDDDLHSENLDIPEENHDDVVNSNPDDDTINEDGVSVPMECDNEVENEKGTNLEEDDNKDDKKSVMPVLRIRKIDEINSTVVESVPVKTSQQVNNGVPESCEVIILSDSDSGSPLKKSTTPRRRLSLPIPNDEKVKNQSKNAVSKKRKNTNDSLKSVNISSDSEENTCTEDIEETNKESKDTKTKKAKKDQADKPMTKNKNNSTQPKNSSKSRNSQNAKNEESDEDQHKMSCDEEKGLKKGNSKDAKGGKSKHLEGEEPASSDHDELSISKKENSAHDEPIIDLSNKNSELDKGKPTNENSLMSEKTNDDITKEEQNTPSVSSTSTSSTVSSTSENSDFEKAKKESKATKKKVTKKTPIVKGLLTSTESDNSDFEVELKKSKSTKKKAKESAKKVKKEVEDNADDSNDAEFKRLMNIKGLDKQKNQSKTSKKEKSEAPTKKKKATKKGNVSLLAELEGEDGLDLLRGEVRRIILSLPGANMCPELPKMEFDCLSDNDSPLDIIFNDSMGSDSSDDLLDSDDSKSRKKKIHLSKKQIKKEESDQEDNETDDSSKNNFWKKDKLLNEKLSDESSDEDLFKKNNEKKKNRNVTVISDSDDDDGKKKSSKAAEPATSMWTSSDSDDAAEKNIKKRKRIKKHSSDSSDENMDASTPKGRKNIKKIKKSDDLNETTQSALKEEQDRKRRIAERQQLYNDIMMSSEFQKSSKVDKVVLEFDLETKEERIVVDDDIVKNLKPHQAAGIKFMWDSCFETVSKAKKGKGSGCILAHCMGLGKTLQVIALLHTLMKYDELKVKTALILCPLSTVLNWASEFSKWLSEVGSGDDIDVFHFTKNTAIHRTHLLKDWHRRGGVMIMGYSLFRILVSPAKRIKAAYKNIFLETLTDPGPDIVICDEGHILKNEATSTSKSVSKIKSLRRIVLTGTPLQNNLIEYHCMVQFVKPELLGTKKDFMNRFVNPIQNGQFVDSTPQDVRIMKRRAHVLHKMLDGIVQRKDYNVLVPFLPPKFEFVLGLNLSEVQIKLYQNYLEKFAQSEDNRGKGATLFKDKSIFHLICSHPRLLKIHAENRQLKSLEEDTDEEGSLKDFIDDGNESSSSSYSSSSSSSNSDSSSSIKSNSKKRKNRRNTRNTKVESENEGSGKEEPEVENKEWWSDLISDEEMEDIRSSTKLFLLFKILEKCHEIGDKLLVFSQSLYVLDLIEFFLQRVDDESYSDNPPESLAGFKGTWIKGLDYFRLDGQSSSENRAIWCNKFNEEDNVRARLFLISTRAGGMGINLTGANRVVIFDASWNPSHDVQSIFRIYRFGQDKPCYIYRFLSKGTMEQKVYDRQVTKLSLSCRVIDEQQVDRHFTYADLNELYTFTPNEKDDKTFIVPKDRLLADILSEGKELVLSYHSHDSLLENQAEEELNEEERQAAWSDFENEKKRQTMPQSGAFNSYMELFNKSLATLTAEHPDWNDNQLRAAANEIVKNVFSYNRTQAQNNAQILQQQQLQQQQSLLAQQLMQQQMMWTQAIKQNQLLQKNTMQGNPVRMQQQWPTQQLQKQLVNFPQNAQNLPRFNAAPNFGTVPQLLNPYAIRPSTSTAKPVAKPVETVNLDDK